MLENFREFYEKKLTVKIITILIVVFLSVATMLPLMKIAAIFGINIKEHTGLNFKVAFGNVFFFLLYGVCAIAIIWSAQKYIHKKKFSELGFRSKILWPTILGFIFGAILISTRYIGYTLSVESVTFTYVGIPEGVSILSYLSYYLYFSIGFIFFNSFIEELTTKAYPIEKLKKYMNPHIIFTIMGVIFAFGHFFARDFNLGYFITLFMFSYIASLIYYYSGSIWLSVGVHSGINWVSFSFMGTVPNWKLGTLYTVEMSQVPSWVINYANLPIQLGVLLLIVLLHKKGFFKKYFPKANEV
jgi:membrane protease YdiL (CAAX protease family)